MQHNIQQERQLQIGVHPLKEINCGEMENNEGAMLFGNRVGQASLFEEVTLKL